MAALAGEGRKFESGIWKLEVQNLEAIDVVFDY